MNPQGYISPSAEISHSRLRLGANVFVGDRAIIYQQDGEGSIEIGDRTSVWGDCLLETGMGGGIRLGPDCRVNLGVQMVSYQAPIEIGTDVGLSAHSLLYSYNHGIAPGTPYMKQPLETRGPIVIEDHAWVGMGSIVLSGVHIGKHAVVAAGSVVTHDVPANTVVGGVPARVLGTRDEFSSQARKLVKE
jgi:acetyltransferase-like isoleucine patch superfamily enzyme